MTILTSDKDIIEPPLTITTTSGKIINFTVTIDKGLIAFTFKDIFDISLTSVMKVIGKILFKFIHEGQKLLSDFINLLNNIIRNKMKSLKLSDLATLAGSISSLIVIYFFNDDFKKSINNLLSILSNNLKAFIDQILEILENIKQLVISIIGNYFIINFKWINILYLSKEKN